MSASLIQEVRELREKLARVEKERNEVCDGLDRQTARLIAAQAQLAEPVGLLRAIEASKPLFNPSCGVTLESLQAFLARHAQAEQQEAREPVLAHPERGCSVEQAMALTMERYGQPGGALEQLAELERQDAQPAAGETVAVIDVNAIADYVADYWPMKKHSLEEIEAGLRSIVLEAAPSAAAFGDEVLLKLFKQYKALADSGDAGFWSLEEDTEAGKSAFEYLKSKGLIE